MSMDDLIRGAAGRVPEPDVPADLEERLAVLRAHGFDDHEARDLLRRHGHDVPQPSGFDGGARRPVLPPREPSMDDALRAHADERREERAQRADVHRRIRTQPQQED